MIVQQKQLLMILTYFSKITEGFSKNSSEIWFEVGTCCFSVILKSTSVPFSNGKEWEKQHLQIFY